MEIIEQDFYHLSSQTIAITASDVIGYQSLILEPGRRIYSHRTSNQMLEESCILSGSTLDGRRSAIKALLGISKKIPVPVNPEKGIFMIPICAIRDKNCTWVSYSHIESFSKQDNQTLITFRDGCSLLVNTTRNSFEHLFYRAANMVVHLNFNKIFPA